MSQSSVYINPLTDFGFKYLFGQEEHKIFLISFLNALLADEYTIEDVEFVDKERLGEHKASRALIYDIHCRTVDGKKIIVEMQNRYQSSFKDRALFYLSADIHAQGRKGNDWNYELTPVFGIFMMNFEGKDFANEQIRDDIGLVNIKTHELFSNKLKMIFLKIPMMDKEAAECHSSFEQWLYLFKHMENMDRIPAAFMNDPVFMKLEDVAKVGALDDKERREYERSLKIYRDNRIIMQTERAEGFAEGVIDEKRMSIHRLITAGQSLDIISIATGLSIDEIKAIIAQEA